MLMGPERGGSQEARPQSRTRAGPQARKLQLQQQAVLARAVQGDSPALPSRAACEATCAIDPRGKDNTNTLRTAAGVVVVRGEIGVDEIQLAVSSPVSHPAANQIRRAQSLGLGVCPQGSCGGGGAIISGLSAALVVEMEEEGLTSPGSEQGGGLASKENASFAVARRSLSLSGRSWSSSRIVTLAEHEKRKEAL